MAPAFRCLVELSSSSGSRTEPEILSSAREGLMHGQDRKKFSGLGSSNRLLSAIARTSCGICWPVSNSGVLRSPAPASTDCDGSSTTYSPLATYSSPSPYSTNERLCASSLSRRFYRFLRIIRITTNTMDSRSTPTLPTMPAIISFTRDVVPL